MKNVAKQSTQKQIQQMYKTSAANANASEGEGYELVGDPLIYMTQDRSLMR